jgi:hypothetical protein
MLYISRVEKGEITSDLDPPHWAKWARRSPGLSPGWLEGHPTCSKGGAQTGGEYHCRPLNLLISKRIQNKSKFRIKIGKINRELFRK